MPRKHSSKELLNKDFTQLVKIADGWNIQIHEFNKTSLIEAIFNHPNNEKNIQSSAENTSCSAMSLEDCLLFDCTLHPDVKPDFYKTHLKQFPTKFYRFPLPICWFVSGIQFLSAIN